MVLKLRLLLKLIFSSWTAASFIQSSVTRSARPVKQRKVGSIRNEWLRLIVHQTRSDRRIEAFGRDPLR